MSVYSGISAMHGQDQLLSYLLSKIPFSFLKKLAQSHIMVLYYHMVCDEEKPYIRHLYRHKNVQQFKDDVDFLLKNYSPVSLFDFLKYLRTGHSLPKDAFLLTFDDGFREMYDIVAPILVKKGIPATFFVNSAFTDNKELCYQHKASIMIEYLNASTSIYESTQVRKILLDSSIICNSVSSGILSISYQRKYILDDIAKKIGLSFDDYRNEYQPYLSSEQISKLIQSGFSIGAHSIDHPLFSSISLDQQLYQTKESVRFVKESFNLSYSAFAFPYSDANVSAQFFREIHRQGMVDVSFGTGGIIKDIFPFNIQRISLEKPLLPAERNLAFQIARSVYRRTRGRGRVVRI
jgi:peptidoglycan/xylan/chitin deacetylase (PgdA/CDA1 family)